MSAELESLLELDEELPVGTTLNGGRFVIEFVICNGGFGIVYRVRDRSNKVFAIKEFFVEGFSERGLDYSVRSPSDYADEISELLNLFSEEGWWPGLMIHPNVMRTFDYFEENGTGYIVMEHIEGADLQDIMDQSPDWLKPDQIVKVGAKISEGLAYLHSNSVVHGDIAPDNIIMRGVHDPVLIDFGSALFENEDDAHNRPPARLRAVKDGYSAPELYNRRLHPTAASDIYSLGATLHHMVAGSAPQAGNRRLEADNRISLTNHANRFPKGFLNGITHALSVQRQDRPTAKEFAALCRMVAS